MMHTPSPANGINKFSTVEFFLVNLFTDKAVFQPVHRRKSVFQPGFNRPKQYKGEMRRMRHLYISIPLSMF